MLARLAAKLELVDDVHGAVQRLVVALEFAHEQLVALEQAAVRRAQVVARAADYERAVHHVVQVADHVEHGRQSGVHAHLHLTTADDDAISVLRRRLGGGRRRRGAALAELFEHELILANALHRLEQIGVERQAETQSQLHLLEEGALGAVLAPHLLRVRLVQAVRGVHVKVAFLFTIAVTKLFCCCCCRVKNMVMAEKLTHLRKRRHMSGTECLTASS